MTHVEGPNGQNEPMSRQQRGNGGGSEDGLMLTRKIEILFYWSLIGCRVSVALGFISCLQIIDFFDRQLFLHAFSWDFVTARSPFTVTAAKIPWDFPA